MPAPYMASSLPAPEVAELHRLMTEEIREVALFFMNPEGVITTWNRAAEEMKGYTAREAIGNHLEILYTDEDRERGWPQHNLRESAAHGYYREETFRRRKDGSLFWARIALTALHDDNGQLVGFSKITMDLTEHMLLERCVREREETHRILRAAKAGTWTWHPDADQMQLSADFLNLLGHRQDEMAMTLSQWLDFVHPADRLRAEDAFHAAKHAGTSSPLLIEIRMRQADGAYRWFSLRADWYREKDDGPLALNGVNVDIQDLKNTGEELQLAFAKLEETDTRKDEFLAMLAHELRNPLAPIRAAAEVLKLDQPDASRMRRTSEIIARQVDHMSSLIDDLLDISRVNRGLVDLDKSPLIMRPVVQEAVEQVNPLIASKRLHFELHLPSDTVAVMGDKKRLVQVLANLLNNAAKYTQEGGNIVLDSEVRDDKLIMCIMDDGIGMTPELVARVFDLFAQAERTPDRASGGLGIGLALVRSLVELHGGTVTCSSDGQGKGSKFSVTLPLVAAAQNRETADEVSKHLPKPAQSLRVMIVDDNADGANMLAMLLESSGHQVLVEHDARRALERAALETPQVCLLDIGLPEINGKELARRLRAQPATANSMLIAISGYGHPHDRDSALAAGFSHYFVKPVDTSSLLKLLSDIGA